MLSLHRHKYNYNAFLYDSIQRCSIHHLITNNIFDTVYSFDDEDCIQYGFSKSHNFIYFDQQKTDQKLKYQILTVASFDKHFHFFNTLAYKLNERKIIFSFIFVSRNMIFKYLRYNLRIILGLIDGKTTHQELQFQSKKITIKQLLSCYEDTKIILDIVQKKQTGLSFRVFEAMGLEKKLITDNQNILKYDFYNPQNKLVIDKNNPLIPDWFLDTNYEPLTDEPYQKYTLRSWLKTIFNLYKFQWQCALSMVTSF